MATGNKLRIVFAWHAAVEPEYRKLFRELVALGHEVTVIAPESWKEAGKDLHAYTAETDGYRLLGLPVAYKNRIKGFFYLDVIALSLTLRMSRPDIVHIFEEPYSASAFQIGFLARHLSPRAKVVIESLENLNIPQRRAFAFFETYTLKRCDALIAVPHDGREVWKAKGCVKPIKQASVGIDENLFKKTEGSIAGLEYLDRRDKLRIAYVGKLTEEQGIGLLLSAFALLVKQGKTPIELLLVGSGDVDKFKGRCKELAIVDDVSFVNAVDTDQLPLIYSKIDILVLPSLTMPLWKEQFGRVLIEAMACGVAVVGSSSGEIPRVIGDAGVIFKEGDRDALVSALTRLAGDRPLRDSYAKAGRERVLEKFTWSRVAKCLVNIYEDALTGK